MVKLAVLFWIETVHWSASGETTQPNCCRMSLENEDQSSVDQVSKTFHETQKQSKISYTREFLLSLRELDICKNLPSGFNQSLLSEFEDALNCTQDWQRISGSLSLQGYGRSDFSSSPPTRGESDNSRVVYGRWESRSSGRSDRDSDSQSDRDSDSGRRYGSQSQRSWQSTEHDGLLGSGSFPRPAGYMTRMSVPRTRANEPYLLNRSNEPYHPPRPYKAVPHSRRDTSDSYNDETFGSTEYTSQDRAEEERKRRASFESMRKEQQKALQEKQKLITDKHKDNSVSDITLLLDDKKGESILLEKNNELDTSATIPVSSNDSAKSSFPATRPLVPPGFTGTTLEIISSSKSSVHTRPTGVGKSEIEESLLHAEGKPLQNSTPGNQEERQTTQEKRSSEWQLEDKSIHALFPATVEIVNPETVLEVGKESHPCRTFSLLEASETLDSSEIIELNAKNVKEHKVLSDSNQHNSTSILEKIFSSASTMNIAGGSGLIKDHYSKQDDTWSSNTVQSSKFAHWFLEEEKKLLHDPSSGSDLLSLIVGSGKSGAQVTDVTATHIPPELSYQSSQHSNGLITSNMPNTTTEQYSGTKQEAAPVVLTCEDLEQTILLEYSEKCSALLPPIHDWNFSRSKIEEPKANVDDCASQHLLSLLQKGTGLTSLSVDSGSMEKLHVSEAGNIGTAIEKPRQAKAENIHNSGKTLTLETLFGTAFMEELQSVEAPVSVQRGSVGSARTDVLEPRGLSFPIVGNELFPSRIDETVSNRIGHESNVLASNQSQHTKLDKTDNWLGYNDPQIEMGSLQLQTEDMSIHDGFDRAVEIQLPEEESLITLSDPVNPSNSMFMPSGNSFQGEEFLSSNTQAGTMDKLATFNAAFKDEHFGVGQKDLPFIRGPYDPVENEFTYRNLHGQPSSSQSHHPRFSHGRPLFHPLDSHPAQINSQVKFMAPQSIIHHDGPHNHELPANMLRPPFHHSRPHTGLTGFDIPAHHPMLQQMQMSGNFPPPHLSHEFTRGGPLPPHSNNYATGFIQEPNPVQGFAFNHRQPNIGGLGMPLPAPDINGGGNHPEAFQRLIEMELRANAKQSHPFVRSQGMLGHELDMGFWYR